MKTSLTELANAEIDSFLERQRLDILKRISAQKRVFGDDVLEISASDVKEVTKQFEFAQEKLTLRSAYPRTQLVLQVYIIIGSVLLIYGIFFNELNTIVKAEPERAAFIAVGVSLASISLSLKAWLETKEHLLRKSKSDALNIVDR